MNQVEHKIQAEFVRHFRLRWPSMRLFLFAIPNGGPRSAISGKRLKDEGLLKGVWDMMLCVSMGTHPGLIIEVKVPRRRNTRYGGLTGDQYVWGSAMSERENWAQLVGYSTQELLDGVEQYMLHRHLVHR